MLLHFSHSKHCHEFRLCKKVSTSPAHVFPLLGGLEVAGQKVKISRQSGSYCPNQLPALLREGRASWLFCLSQRMTVQKKERTKVNYLYLALNLLLLRDNCVSFPLSPVIQAASEGNAKNPTKTQQRVFHGRKERKMYRLQTERNPRFNKKLEAVGPLWESSVPENCLRLKLPLILHFSYWPSRGSPRAGVSLPSLSAANTHPSPHSPVAFWKLSWMGIFSQGASMTFLILSPWTRGMVLKMYLLSSEWRFSYFLSLMWCPALRTTACLASSAWSSTS